MQIIIKMFIVIGLIVGMIIGGIKIYQNHNPNEVKNFDKHQKATAFEYKILSNQSIHGEDFSIIQDLDTKCRYITYYSSDGNGSGDSNLVFMDCAKYSDKKSGFRLLKNIQFFYPLKETVVDLCYDSNNNF